MSDDSQSIDSNWSIDSSKLIASNIISTQSQDIVFQVNQYENEVLRITYDGKILFNNGELELTQKQFDQIISGEAFIVSRDGDNWIINNKKITGELESTLVAVMAKRKLTDHQDVTTDEIIDMILDSRA